MSQRSTSPLKRSTVRRTLQRFWDVTRTQPLIVFLSVFSSAGYIFLLTFANTYVMALIVDRVQAGPVAGDQVFEVFSPYILALVLVNLVGQILSKLQDYTVYKLEIAGNYHLARLCFDTLSNQSMTFHTSRFGGSLVSQTSRFMSGYTGLVDVTVYSLIPTITSVVCTVAALAPVVPTFTVILVGIMVVYIAFVWLMYKRIMPLSAATSAAQNKLSGVLSDAVTNILAVKTCGREDFERDLFDTADRAARDAETVSMHAMMQRNFTTSGLIVITMAVVSVFVAGGNFLMCVFLITLSALFFIVAAYSSRSPYSEVGADRETLQVMAYEPTVLFVAVCMFLALGTFDVAGVANIGLPMIVVCIPAFLALMFVLTIKLRKSPFDLSYSHHAHQELVKGVTTEMSGRTLAKVEVMHWCETTLFLGWVAMFFIWDNPVSIVLAVVVAALAFFLEIFIDNNFARVKWQKCLKWAWIVALVCGLANTAWLVFALIA